MSLPQLSAKIETLLFVAARPFTALALAELLEVDETGVKDAIEVLRQSLADAGHGLQLVSNGRQWELVTHPDFALLVESFVKAETQGELTRPQLETLAIIGYRGPITKTELEAIRGVHCGMILRNLAMRGLIEEETDATLAITRYRVSLPFLQKLGVSRPEDLPQYGALHGNEIIDRLLHRELAPSQSTASPV